MFCRNKQDELFSSRLYAEPIKRDYVYRQRGIFVEEFPDEANTHLGHTRPPDYPRNLANVVKRLFASEIDSKVDEEHLDKT